MPQPGLAMSKALYDAHFAGRPPHEGTDRGEALEHLMLMIVSTADDLDRTAREAHRRIAASRRHLDTLAAGGALTPVYDDPVMATAGGTLDILTAVATTHTHHLKFLIHTYKQLNTRPATCIGGASD